MFRRPIADIHLLQDFNPALVSCFEPEADPRLGEQDMEKLAYVVNKAHQYEDMLTGYMHAQESILPVIRKKSSAKITKQQLLSWISETHARIAAHLAESHDCVAGEYTKKPIVRWHYSSTTQTILAGYCENYLTESQALDLLKECDVDETLAKDILKITNALVAEVKEALANNLLETSVDRADPEFLSRTTIAFFRNKRINNLFSQAENEIIDRFVKFSTDPKDIAPAMNKFAEKLLNKWQQCDGKNVDELCDLLYFAFYQLTEIHPFFNGNGRTATCLVNILLRSYGLPSILIREPGEREDKNSIYSLAIAGLECGTPNPAPFIALIKHRLAQAEETGPYVNSTLDVLIKLRCRLASLRQRILALSSAEEEFKRHLAVNDTIMPEVNRILNGTTTYCDANALAVLNMSIPHYEVTLKEFSARTKPSVQLAAIVRFNPTAKTYTAEDKNALAATLAKLSSHQQWKIYVKNGALVALHTVLNDEQALALINALQKTGACDAILQRVSTDKSLVVYVSNINIDKLKSMCSSNETTSSPKKAM